MLLVGPYFLLDVLAILAPCTLSRRPLVVRLTDSHFARQSCKPNLGPPMFRNDFRNYSNDADEWARRTSNKIKQMDIQLMPSMLEWKIHSVEIKRKELRPPQFLRSNTFDLGGVSGMKIDWYPNGLYAGGAGGASLRLYAPLGTHIRYILRIGHKSMGQRTWSVQPNDAPWDEVHFEPSWIQEIHENSCVVCLEVLENFSSNDGGTFGTIVRLESD